MNTASKSNTSVSNISSRLVRMAQWRYASAWAITRVVAAIGVLFLGSLAYILVRAAIELPEVWRTYPAYQRGALGPVDQAFFGIGLQLMIWLPASVYAALYVLPFILTLPVSSPIIGLWQAPPCFLFLRPFNRGLLSRALKRVARRDVAPLGHIYTLSDADINVPWYVRIPILLGQLALFSFRMRTIRDEKQVERLNRAVDRTWLRNINWCMSFGKVFPVASSDACWREVVNCLLKRCSAVIVDVSDLRENVTWEIDQAKVLGVESRILYLISSERADNSRAALAQTLGEAACASRLFRYGRSGLADRAQFTAALAETVAAEAAGKNSQQPTRSPNRLAIATIAAFVVGMIPVLALAFPGFADLLGLPRWNPWEHPAYWPGVAKVVNAGAAAVSAFGVATWVLLLIAAKRTETIRFLFVVQTLLLLAAPIGMLDW